MNELLGKFHDAGVRYLLIGGQAMRLAGMPRFSMDWDFFIPPRDGENFIQTYQTRWGVVQFHLGLPGVPRFDEAEQTATIRKNEHGTPVKCLSGIYLLSAKEAANRPQDQTDIEFLLELQRLGKLK